MLIKLSIYLSINIHLPVFTFPEKGKLGTKLSPIYHKAASRSLIWHQIFPVSGGCDCST